MLKKWIAVFLSLTLCGCAAQDAEPTTNAATDTVAASLETVATSQETTTAATEPVFDPYAIAQTMSTQELVGQLFLARYPGTEQALADIAKLHLGGYILFGKDFEYETPGSVKEAIAACQAASKLPLFIAVDEEGGSVTRVSCFPQFRSERFPSPRKLYNQGGMELLLSTEEEKSKLLCSLGINVNMAPVCDITTDPAAFMYSRSLGQDPQTTGTFVSRAGELMSASGVGSVLKHFPGYGNNTDTHTGIAYDSRSLETLQSTDLIPFRMAIENGCSAILVSHTIVTCLDPDVPASLSSAVISYLRSEMAFDGVVVTDDLVMQAITDRYGAGESAVMAVQAGCDLLCSSEYATQYGAVLDAVTDGRISHERLIESAARILQWKYELGLLANY